MSVHLVLHKKIKTNHPTPSGTPKLVCGAHRKTWTVLHHTSDPKVVQVTCGACIREGIRLNLMEPPKRQGPTRREREAAARAVMARSIGKQNIQFIAHFRNLIGE